MKKQIWSFITASTPSTADGTELPEEPENPSAGGRPHKRRKTTNSGFSPENRVRAFQHLRRSNGTKQNATAQTWWNGTNVDNKGNQLNIFSHQTGFKLALLLKVSKLNKHNYICCQNYINTLILTFMHFCLAPTGIKDMHINLTKCLIVLPGAVASKGVHLVTHGHSSMVDSPRPSFKVHRPAQHSTREHL